MKCKMCDGAGVIQGQAPGLVSCCPACDGKGFIEQTNEEWFCQLPTGEKAAVLNLKFNSANVCRLPTYDEIVKWLKQPHTPIS